MKITPIRTRRINAGLDTEEVLKKLKISKSMFYKLEQGHRTPSADLIVKMAKVYNCTTDEIFKDFKIIE